MWEEPRWEASRKPVFDIALHYEATATSPTSARRARSLPRDDEMPLFERSAFHGPSLVVTVPLGSVDIGAVLSPHFGGFVQERDWVGGAAMLRASLRVLDDRAPARVAVSVDAGLRNSRTPRIVLSEELRLGQTSHVLPRVSAGVDAGLRIGEATTLFLGASGGWERSVERTLENLVECYGRDPFGGALCRSHAVDWRVGGFFGGVRAGVRFEL